MLQIDAYFNSENASNFFCHSMEIRFESGGKEKSIFDTFDFELKSNIYVLLGAYS